MSEPNFPSYESPFKESPFGEHWEKPVNEQIALGFNPNPSTGNVKSGSISIKDDFDGLLNIDSLQYYAPKGVDVYIQFLKAPIKPFQESNEAPISISSYSVIVFKSFTEAVVDKNSVYFLLVEEEGVLKMKIRFGDSVYSRVADGAITKSQISEILSTIFILKKEDFIESPQIRQTFYLGIKKHLERSIIHNTLYWIKNKASALWRKGKIILSQGLAHTLEWLGNKFIDVIQIPEIIYNPEAKGYLFSSLNEENIKKAIGIIKGKLNETIGSIDQLTTSLDFLGLDDLIGFYTDIIRSVANYTLTLLENLLAEGIELFKLHVAFVCGADNRILKLTGEILVGVSKIIVLVKDRKSRNELFSLIGEFFVRLIKDPIKVLKSGLEAFDKFVGNYKEKFSPANSPHVLAYNTGEVTVDIVLLIIGVKELIAVVKAIGKFITVLKAMLEKLAIVTKQTASVSIGFIKGVRSKLNSLRRTTYSSVAKNISKSLDEFGKLRNVKAFEDFVRNKDKEFAKLFSTSGDELSDIIEGFKFDVKIPLKDWSKAVKKIKALGKRIDDIIVVHNHPIPSALSTSDIKWVVKRKVKGIRAIGNNGPSYSLIRKGTKPWPSDIIMSKLDKKIKAILNNKYPKIDLRNIDNHAKYHQDKADLLLEKLKDYVDFDYTTFI